MLEILATWEDEIGRISVPDKPRKGVCEAPRQPIAGCGGAYLSSQLQWVA
jgi:hypothetical protein